MVQIPLRAKTKPPRSKDFSNDLGGFHQSGRQDLNLRPLGPESSQGASDGFAQGPSPSHPPETTEGGAPRPPPPVDRISTETTKRGAPVVRNFLKVREVATALSVCRATVYRLLDEGRLERYWVGTSIRVPAESLAAYLQASGPDVELLLDVAEPGLDHE